MKISVLTPSYNSGKYFERAIRSVINQNYVDFEHIVADGGSTDNTMEILTKHAHLKYVSEPDKGQSDAMNKAFKMSSGEIIVYLNADDEFAPGAFQKIIKAFEAHPEADMIIGDLAFTDLQGTKIRVPSIRYVDVLQYWKNLFPNNPVSYFYKRHVQEHVGEFGVDEHYTMDYTFLLKAYRKFRIVKIDEVLGTFHSDGLNKTAVVNSGLNSHKTVKQHLKKESPLMLLYFYFLFFKDRFFGS